MLSRTMIASDLDRTLIYSPTALQLSMADELAPTLVSVEVLDGRPHSFLTAQALTELGRLSGDAAFVPTTTRSLSQYQRVHLPGVSAAAAITSNGGSILFDGVADEDWRRSVVSETAATGTTLVQVKQELRRRTEHEWLIKRRTADELFCYVVVDVEQLPVDFLSSWQQWCAERGWQVSMQGRKIYAIPRPLSKERAMREVADRLGAGRVLAAGDGALDSGFLVAADAGFRPPHGELHGLGWTHPTVTVGKLPGVLGGQEIVSWFADQL